jgi:hypothetical protein
MGLFTISGFPLATLSDEQWSFLLAERRMADFNFDDSNTEKQPRDGRQGFGVVSLVFATFSMLMLLALMLLPRSQDFLGPYAVATLIPIFVVIALTGFLGLSHESRDGCALAGSMLAVVVFLISITMVALFFYFQPRLAGR